MSEGHCGVSIGGYDGDEAQLYHESFVKAARKAHDCHECQEPIAVGAPYARVSMVFEGDFSTHKFCMPCWEAIETFSEDGKTFGVLWPALREEWGNGAHVQACLNRLTSARAKAHLLRQWRKWKQL